MGSDLVVLESNFEDSMLAVSSYPYFLKQRIRSDRGHLSNADCASTLVRLAQSGSTRFILGHLSQENNSPSVALQAAHMALGAAGMCENRDYILQVEMCIRDRDTCSNTRSDRAGEDTEHNHCKRTKCIGEVREVYIGNTANH